MDERMLRLKDFLESYLLSEAKSPEERAQELYRARYPFRHPEESHYDFCLRINAYKNPEQICAEIERSGNADDFYCEYHKVERRSCPFGNIYVETIHEMRLLVRSKQLTEAVMVALLKAGVPMNDVYDAIAEDERTRIYTKPIILAAIGGDTTNLKMIDRLCSGKGRWESHSSAIFDDDVMLALLSANRMQFISSIACMNWIPEFVSRLESCRAKVRSGEYKCHKAKGNTLMDDIGL